MSTSERITKMMDGKYQYTVKIRTTADYHYIDGPFQLKDEFKAMQGAKWMGYDKEKPEKVWRVNNCRRNNFNLNYLEGKFPFARYKSELKAPFLIPTERTDNTGKAYPIRVHQTEMALHILCRKQCIISGEMGVGKSLSAIIAAELSLAQEIWWVAPKSALASVKLQCQIWRCRANIRFMTYEELKKIVADWSEGKPPPTFVIFDESSRVKTPSAQRSQVAFYLAEQMRNTYGENCYIVLMTGSPAPKSPLDWWMQCEIACPGYIKEGDIKKFGWRLSVTTLRDDIAGIKFSQHLAWKDGNQDKCGRCGQHRSAQDHIIGAANYHDFTPMPNEIEKLYRRLSGLVLVKFKKDCIDLPDKMYQVINLKPSIDLLRAARLVVGQSKSAMESLILLRELSDGFQYNDVVGKDVCSSCNGNKFKFNPDTGEKEPCKLCSGTGEQLKKERETKEIPSPKLDALDDLLDQHEDVGRLVVYAGFTASIDRICEFVKKKDWHFIRVDGRGWYNSFDPKLTDVDLLKEFQNKESPHDKICFVGHPGSAGMGITLTASPSIVYFSNDFNAESRIQSEDRIHRMGMDENRGATIYDLVLLPTDQKVLDNLRRKRELQAISLGELKDAIENYAFSDKVAY